MQVVFQFFHASKAMIVEAFLLSDVVPEVFHRVEFGTVGWQQFQLDVGRRLQVFAFVPAGTIGKQQDLFLRIRPAESLQQLIHGFCIAERRNEAVAFSLKRTHSTEHIGVFADDLLFDGGSFLLWHPTAAQIVDAPKASLIFKEDFQWLCLSVFCKEQLRGFFLKASLFSLTSPAFVCCGRGAFFLQPWRCKRSHR